MLLQGCNIHSRFLWTWIRRGIRISSRPRCDWRNGLTRFRRLGRILGSTSYTVTCTRRNGELSNRGSTAMNPRKKDDALHDLKNGGDERFLSRHLQNLHASLTVQIFTRKHGSPRYLCNIWSGCSHELQLYDTSSYQNRLKHSQSDRALVRIASGSQAQADANRGSNALIFSSWARGFVAPDGASACSDQ